MTSYANMHVITNLQLNFYQFSQLFCIGNDTSLTGNGSDLYLFNEAPGAHNILHSLSHC